MTRSTSGDEARPDLAGMRRSYDREELIEADLAGDWTTQFGRWFDDATLAGLPEPNAMTLATSSPDGRPSARTVLLKGFDTEGFTFFTNYRSRKGTEVAANPYASLVFGWFTMHRQVVVTGRVERVARAVTETYFATRPRESQLGAWASPQSSVVDSRTVLDEALATVETRYPEGETIPAPPNWGGLLVRPETVEFWQGRVGRLHDRLRYRRDDERGWIVERLGP